MGISKIKRKRKMGNTGGDAKHKIQAAIAEANAWVEKQASQTSANPRERSGDLRFTTADMVLFAQASGDTSPLHTDPAHCRQTPFGEPLVYGGLGAMACLGHLEGDAVIRRLEIAYQNPFFVDVPYQVQVISQDDSGVEIALRDGDLTLVRLKAGFGEPNRITDDLEPHFNAAERGLREASPQYEWPAYEKTMTDSGPFQSDHKALQSLAKRFGIQNKAVSNRHLDTLVYFSYLSGMVFPGYHGMSSQIRVDFTEPGPERQYGFRAKTEHFDNSYGLLSIATNLSSENGLAASGQLKAFVRKSLPPIDLAEFSHKDKAEGDLSGKTALVVGGSRGLGEAMVKGLALRGAHVILNFKSCKAQAEQIISDLSQAPGKITLLQGDAGDPDFWQDRQAWLKKEVPALDLLVCNAVTPLLPIGPGASDAELRAKAYLESNLALAQVPAEALTGPLTKAKGTLVAISDADVEDETQANAYLLMKRALETWLDDFAASHKKQATLLARAPGMLTDFSNRPSGNPKPVNTVRVAEAILDNLTKAKAGKILTLGPEDLGGSPTPTPAPSDQPPAKEPLVISATFTAEPIEPALAHVLETMDLPYEILWAPYNQLFQELLNPESQTQQNASGVNVMFLRLEDWLRNFLSEDGHGDISKAPRYTKAHREYLEKTCEDFLGALQAHAGRSNANTLIMICPSGEAYGQNQSWQSLFEKLQARIDQVIGSLSNVAFMDASESHRRFGNPATFDQVRDEIGHIPFTNDYFYMLANLVCRRIFAWKSKPYKVIVLDCDNTLWKGVCGEVGPEGVSFEGHYQALQSFLIDQTNQGMVLCLASKNVEEDVWNVFDQRDDMLLKRDHIVDTRINWSPKSANIIAMAKSLNLGLDSFIFIDDNPVEVAEVRANAPEVLVIQWPSDPDHGQRILDHTWVFDHYDVTQEDKKRTKMYQANVERENLLSTTGNFDSFIASLDLNIAVEPMSKATMPRLTQLTNRTNQFNFTTVRRTQNEVEKQEQSGSHEFWTVTVSDRFGDYGLVGVMIMNEAGTQLEVDSFMLSCRVLGRGVEYRMLAHIGQVAVDKGLESVKVVYRKTAKNLPAKNFIDNVGKDYAEVIDEDTVIYTFPSKTLSELRWKPKPAPDLPKASAKDVAKAEAKLTSVRQRETQMGLLADTLANPEHVLSSLNQTPTGKPQAEPGPTTGSAPTMPVVKPNQPGKDHLLRAAVLTDVKEVFGNTLELEPDLLVEDEPLETYVNDSFKNVEITVELKKHFPNVPSTVLFEHRNMASIAEAFIADNRALLQERYAEHLASAAEPAPAIAAEPSAPRQEVAPEIKESTPIRGSIPDQGDIAIIGVEGIYPEAKHARELWDILTEGRSVIGEVPAERWDMKALFGAKGEPDKSYCKWGGFISDVDKFDPSFFQITPKEIEVMDPQQRLMLQVAWSLIEDAGYTRQTIERETGVFVAVVSNDYGNFANEAALQGRSAYRWTDYYQIPNRVSYFFDFQGPSLAVDTACSGAGTALHLACQSLRKGDIKTAIVGGVNLFLHPSRFVQYSQMQMLTDEPHCRPFGAGANGTLFGEGVGALLLKPLADAERDGDNIYATIKATAINSGGKTNGFTVPNPQAHAALITQALKESGIDPRTISYMEAHGTGTSLGDPIEIRGLNMAYRNNADPSYGELPNQYCALGSLKANIGHLESAAAISSITKILLQMKHRKLVPSINASVTNPLIDFVNSPFKIQQTLEPWEQPKLHQNGETMTVPRRAAVSSFGAGGSNAHAILEEYVAKTPSEPESQGPWLIVVSAKTKTALEAASLNLANFLEQENATVENGSKGINLDHLAYTLQVGREAMNYRMATVVPDAKTLIDRLKAFASGKKAGQVFSGHARKDKSTADMLIAGEEGLAYLQLLIKNRKLDKLAQLWVAGVGIQWNLLTQGKPLKRLSLPTYPFEGERYWLPKTDEAKLASTNSGQVVAKLHPLITRNISTLESQGYLQTFTGKEFVLDHHIVSKEKVLPAVAYLEMARVAGNLAHPKCQVRKIQNIVWAQRFTFSEENNQVHVNLLPHDGIVNYQVCTVKQGDKPVVHTSGKILYDSQAPCQPENKLDLDAIRQRCAKRVSHEKCYDLYRSNGFDYGAGFKPIVEMFHNDSEALSYLELPKEVADDFSRYLLHPTLMDGALQTVIGLTGETVALSHTPWLPFGMGELEIYKPLQSKAYAYVKLASNHKSGSSHIKKFEIFLTDDEGNPLVHVKDYSLRAVPEHQRVLHHSDDPQAMTTLYYRDEWKEMPVRLFDELGDSRQLAGLGHLLLFDTSRELAEVLQSRLAEADQAHKVSLVTPGERFIDKGEGQFEIDPNSPMDYNILLQALQAQGRMPKHILHLWSKDQLGLDRDKLETQLQHGAFAIFHLSKALITAKVRDDVQLLYVHSSDPDQHQPQFTAVSGMAKTIHIENPKLAFKIIDLQNETQSSNGVSARNQATLLLTELLIWTGKAVEIRFKGGQRFAKYLQEFDLPKAIAKEKESAKAVTIRRRGTYLITGGMGGLGKLFATHLAKNYEANLVLVGRSQLNDEGQKTIDDLQSLGATVLHISADVGQRDQVMDMVAKARKRFDSIDGIIHAAGMIRDGFVLKKSLDEFQTVLEPKVQGTVNLDEATSDESLDFFVMFSSLTSLIGNVGQVDYALGNRFMDAYAVYRNEQVAGGKRSGKSLAINWPFWKEGGMRVDEASEKALTDTMGMRALETELGIQAFEDGLAFSGSQFLVLEGAFQKVRKALGIAVVEEERQLNQAQRFLEEPTTKTAAKPAAKPETSNSGAVNKGELKQQTETFLKEVLSKETKLPMAKIIADEPLEEYGIDSVMILTLSGELEKVFGELSKTLLFEYQSIAELTEYFTEHHEQTLLEMFQVSQSTEAAETTEAQPAAPVAEKPLEIAGLNSPRFLTGTLHTAPTEPTPDEDIAIIGVSGRYPLARNLAEFWENLQNGRDCIEEIPGDRWDWRSNYDPDKNAYGKTYSKWGGFLDGVADFDPLFFNISPKEAGLIDPQERLFLETTWQALEDAGYTRGNFGKSSVGVYVGVMWGHYQLYGPEEAAKGNIITPDSSYASIANRVSYFFNFQGPSMAVDTMCSSSLTAIHLACEAIHRGEIKTAIAGGVNLSIHPSKYVGLSAGKFTSSDGRCRSFGEGGDGYVPGEGVGAVILKPLSQAIRHKDHIYAVIKGTSINHGGKTNGYTVPNPNAQGELVKLALKRADIDPRSISYIEAHGTGTALGDPIEVTGLKRAYSGANLDLQSCPIGSVKSNVGHLEAAAGIAGLTKILLQMKFRKIAPSLHSKVLNPNINFKDTPFYVNQHLVDWEQPTVKTDNHFKAVPRRAGISSFGAGGSNAHLILEEFEMPAMSPSLENRAPHIIVLSAKNEDRLRHYVRKMLNYLEQFGNEHAGAQDVDEDLLAKIQYSIVRATATILKVNVQEVEIAEEFLELGLDQVGQATLLQQLNQQFDLDLGNDIFHRCPTIEEMALHLYRDFKGMFQTHFTSTIKRPDLKPVDITHINLTAMAYTLQAGREAMPERLAVVVENVDALMDRFKAYLEGETAIQGMHLGNVRTQTTASGMLVEGEEGEAFLQNVFKKRRYGKIAQLWVSGVSIDWNLLYPDGTPQRISLPTYPFDRKRHWFPQKSAPSRTQTAAVAHLHPLVGRNISNLTETKFVTDFKGESTNWLTKTAEGLHFLPHATALEMGRAALATIGETASLWLRDMRWSSQVIGPKQGSHQGDAHIQLHLLDESNGQFGVEIFSQKSGHRHIHLQAILEANPDSDYPNLLDLEALRASLNQESTHLRLGDETALFHLPETAEADQAIVLNPTLLNGAVHAAAQLSGMQGLVQPSSAASLSFRFDFQKARYAQVRRHPGEKDTFEVLFATDDGTVVGHWSKLQLQVATLDAGTASQDLFSTLEWLPSPITGTAQSSEQGDWLVFVHDEQIGSNLQAKRAGRGHLVKVLAGDRFEEIDQDTYRINPANEADFTRLLTHLSGLGFEPKQIVHLWTMSLEGYVNDLNESLNKVRKQGINAVHHLIKALSETGTKSAEGLTVFFPGQGHQGNPALQALAGFSRSAARLFSKFTCRTVQVEAGMANNALLQWITDEVQQTAARQQADVRLVKGKRLALKAVPFDPPKPQPLPNLDGALVISGGAGGLGLLFAHHFAEKPGAKLVLLGRSDLGSQRKAKLSPLEEKGAEVIYLRADVADRASLSGALDRAREHFGSIAGVIHAAGRNDETQLTKKPFSDFQATLQPKIAGTVHLDQLTQSDPLQFFVMFSSTSAFLGDFGQCDYAIGNRFMDHYAVLRDELREKGMRHGRSLSIDWPLWRDGGMHLDEAAENFYLRTSGMAYLETDAGLGAFDALLSSQLSHALILSGQVSRLKRILGLQEETAKAMPANKPAPSKAPAKVAKTQGSPAEKLLAELRALVSELLHIESHQVDIHENLGDFGFDSISLTDFAERLSNRFEVDITPNLFFTHPTLASLHEHFQQEHKDALVAAYPNQGGDAIAEAPAVEETVFEPVSAPVKTETAKDTGLTPMVVPRKSATTRVASPGQSENEPVAIIGLAGMFPGSPDVESFWKNLHDEVDLVTEIPGERWDWRQFDGDPHSGDRKTHCRWGGFVPDVDHFDARFFQISPLEANLMDPQHRLFLQTVWKTIEDAGYKASDLSGKPVGLYVGAQFSDYAELIGGKQASEPFAPTGNVHSILANRVSYLLNLRGPSEPINTACSSALVAIHHAVRSIQSGESTMAIAGAVCLMLTPTNMLDASQLSMLAKDGRCKTFDKSADGFVKGEGIGAVLLKPLSQAIADRDHIYAVVRGAGINHGGKATSLTAPNPNAQAELIASTHAQAGFEPETVSYVETHGTGTELGDPVEVDGLNLAFRKLAKGRELANKPWCKLGAVKTNIGHLEPAAGIAGVTKVLMAMKYGKLPGTLHLHNLNPFLKLNQSPFEVVQHTQSWDRILDESGKEIPRRAGVSSFGFGGVNGHVALEEYLVPAREEVAQPCLIVLSARQEDRLRAMAANLATHFEQMDPAQAPRLIDVAFTLQMGREPMNERLAFVANSLDDIAKTLREYLAGNNENVAHGNAATTSGQGDLLLEGNEGRTFLETIIHDGKLAKVGKLWVLGVDLDWHLLYNGLDDSVAPQRVSLPTYAFAPQRHWVADPAPLAAAGPVSKPIHPLLHRNLSDLAQIRYTTRLTGSEFFLSDHVVGHEKVLPGVAYLEMAGAAAVVSGGRRVRKINDIVWIKPLAVNGHSASVAIQLQPTSHHTSYQVFTENGSERLVHAEGRLVYENGAGKPNGENQIDLAAIKQRCQDAASGQTCYQRFESMDLHYGTSFRSVQTLWHNHTEALAFLELPRTLAGDFHQFVLHPTLLDGALQTVSGLMKANELASGTPYIPYALDEVEILRPMTTSCYAYVAQAGSNQQTSTHLKRFNVTLTDTEGRPLIYLRDFTLRQLNPGPAPKGTGQPHKPVSKPVTKASSGVSPLLDGFVSEEDEVLI